MISVVDLVAAAKQSVGQFLASTSRENETPRTLWPCEMRIERTAGLQFVYTLVDRETNAVLWRWPSNAPEKEVEAAPEAGSFLDIHI